jgi:hypothetical protein
LKPSTRATSRNAAGSEIDLRWGITEQQATEEEVLPICLEKIHRCRPHSVALLRECYGWVSARDDSPKQLIAQQPWLAAHKHLPGEALPVARQAHRIASKNGITDLPLAAQRVVKGISRQPG